MPEFSTKRPVSAEAVRETLLRESSERQVNRELLHTQQLMEAEEAKLQAELAAQEKKEKEEEERNKVLEATRQRTREQLAAKELAEATANIAIIGGRNIVRETLTNIMMEGLWIDDEIKTSDNIKEEVRGTLEGIIAKCEKVTGTTVESNMKNTAFLECLSDLAKEKGRSVADRILEEATRTKPTKIEFKMTNEELDDLDDDITNLGGKQLSSAIKKKVLDTIKAERKSGKVKSQLFQELDDASDDDEDAVDECIAIAESLYHSPVSVIEESISAINVENPFVNWAEQIKVALAVADRCAVDKDFEKSIELYDGIQSLVDKGHTITSDVETYLLDDAIGTLVAAIDLRKFEVYVTGKVTKRDMTNAGSIGARPVVSLMRLIKEYCASVAKACKNKTIGTETVDELKRRLVKESVGRQLNASIGTSVFESFMIRNTCNINKVNPVLESGRAMLESEKQNAALLQTILEYTALETLNTLKVFKLDRESLTKIKNM